MTLPESIEVSGGRPGGPRFMFHIQRFLQGDPLCMQALLPHERVGGSGSDFISGSKAERLAGR
jgi:hypothetical protein